MAGFGNWSGNGVGFGVYSPTGGVLGGTGVCLYTDINGDGKLTCGEVGGCAAKTGGSPESFVVGGATGGSGTIPPPGFICGTVRYRDANGNDDGGCVAAQTDPKKPLDVSGLKDCCPCLTPNGSANGDQQGGGRHLTGSGTQSDDAAVPIDPTYDWSDKNGQLQMRVSHNAAGSSWTILAATVLGASSIELIEVSPAGQVVQRQALPTTTTSEGLRATWSGTPRADHYTVFSARSQNGALVNYFVNSTLRGTAPVDQYFSNVYNATFK